MTHPGPVSAVASGDTSILVPAAGVTLIVGANSAGKSTALRDIATGISIGMFGDVRLVVTKVEFSDPSDEAIAALAEPFVSVRDGITALRTEWVEAIVDDNANTLARVAVRHKAATLASARGPQVSILDGSSRLGSVDP